MSYNRQPARIEYGRQWAENNRDKTRAKHNRWRGRNADSERARSRQWFATHPVYYDWYRKTPRGRALRAAYLAAYRAVKARVPVEHLEVLKQIYAACPPGYEVDHIVPISKGGKHVPDNLQYLTADENKRKCARTDYSPKGAIPWRDILPSTTIPQGSTGKHPEARSTQKRVKI